MVTSLCRQGGTPAVRGHPQLTGTLDSALPGGMVRDATLASPAWPDMAAAMGRLDGQGVDVQRLLADAHAASTRASRPSSPPRHPRPRQALHRGLPPG
ncbi:hypothetical protein ACQKM2_39580 [Streptomyces sp. NPDC004126]|uniref:hypothetical protein n=1 Tax=Streptomyces sp. NPDC004126 TaxID=3390695 RepID=UPI003CFE29BE